MGGNRIYAFPSSHTGHTLHAPCPMPHAPCPKTPDTILDAIEFTSVLDSVVSQFTIANIIYKIVEHEASAKGWFATGN